MASTDGSCTVVPLEDKPFGAEVFNVDLRQPLTDDQWSVMESALAEHSLLIFRGQHALQPADEVRFAQYCSPGAKTAWRDQRTNPWERFKAEHMGGAGTFQLPRQPEVLVLGNGEVVDHHGLTERLGGARPAYGARSGSQVLGGGSLQWHIDGAFFERLPPHCTQMFCVESPSGLSRKVTYGPPSSKATNLAATKAVLAATTRAEDGLDAGSMLDLDCPLGGTAFASGRVAYEALSAEDRARCDGAVIEHYMHPFYEMRSASTTPNGLRTEPIATSPASAPTAGPAPTSTSTPTPTPTPTPSGSGSGSPLHPPSPQRLPMVWCHPRSDRRALMVQGRCMSSIRTADGSVIAGDAARHWCEKLMFPAIHPSLVYVHAWQPGDLVLWDNHALWHSATGGLPVDCRRVMHLVSLDGTRAPRPTPAAAAAAAAAGPSAALAVDEASDDAPARL